MQRYYAIHGHGLVVFVAYRVGLPLLTVVALAGMNLFDAIFEIAGGYAAGYEAYLAVVGMGVCADAASFVEGDAEYLVVIVYIGGAVGYAYASQHLWDMFSGKFVEINHGFLFSDQ